MTSIASIGNSYGSPTAMIAMDCLKGQTILAYFNGEGVTVRAGDNQRGDGTWDVPPIQINGVPIRLTFYLTRLADTFVRDNAYWSVKKVGGGQYGLDGDASHAAWSKVRDGIIPELIAFLSSGKADALLHDGNIEQLRRAAGRAAGKAKDAREALDKAEAELADADAALAAALNA